MQQESASEQYPCQMYQNDKKFNIIIKSEEIEMLTEYDKDMIEKYQKQIDEDGKLTIENNKELKNMDFIKFLKIKKLELLNCQNRIHKLESKTIQALHCIDCNIQSLEEYQLENLEIISVYNYDFKESNNMAQELSRFQKLQLIFLEGFIIDIDHLLKIKGLTKLILYSCQLPNTQALRQFVNLEELHLSYNTIIDVSTLQYMTKLTKLSIISCNLIGLDALKTLINLEELIILNNQIVYIQPLAKLKKLSQLDARFNKIIDSNEIEQHSNYMKFDLSYQDQPTKQQLKAANLMRDINLPIVLQNKLYRLTSNLKTQNNIFRKIISGNLKKQYEIQQQFITRIASLLYQMNAIEPFQ
ncbi:leucine-rich_repeat domain-containing protein [Hexamita inflata]|uniref:Leucine-rich repeat domain-containing protein n=1 Tax=Hexamita inflata TaxID=28002 RepID=A0AA86NVL7_9EUKA|nr:leucine-rich repeat domain-containing protein [Hexamita inflata]